MKVQYLERTTLAPLMELESVPYIPTMGSIIQFPMGPQLYIVTAVAHAYEAVAPAKVAIIGAPAAIDLTIRIMVDAFDATEGVDDNAESPDA